MRKSTERLLDVGLVSVTLGVVIFAAAMYFVADPLLKNYIYAIAFATAIGPLAYVQYMRYLELKDIEKNFPIFLQDIAENVRSGMTLVKAVKNLESKNYGRMTKHVRKIASKLDWGISFSEVMNSFAEEVDDPLITRTVKTLIETHKFGGKIEDVLTAVVNSVITVENLRKEREAEIFSQIINGYLIYVMFLGIIVVMIKFLIPMMARTSAQGIDISYIKTLFRSMIFIQSIFSGLILGKMAEGTISAGFKHILLMSAMGYIAAVIV